LGETRDVSEAGLGAVIGAAPLSRKAL
jgi:hypothetical protein